ncbi:hypothetical protein [Desulfofundulus thermosubterraneus]|uniref:Uncharacterized protein n=1 Tax=Desulfofundulus thermosubterraneus DSM 16057 TaxID=1121432 RepID=A0A1M6AN83_9FIRM|nr:hypothetical protein [Desulfofundulus thermosubterraneus]SHI37979.1 hypothetical protein SAMN02745219_00213 [Desulfofundulus thermosubterraneus DSM 16057]
MAKMVVPFFYSGALKYPWFVKASVLVLYVGSGINKSLFVKTMPEALEGNRF